MFEFDSFISLFIELLLFKLLLSVGVVVVVVKSELEFLFSVLLLLFVGDVFDSLVGLWLLLDGDKDDTEARGEQ